MRANCRDWEVVEERFNRTFLVLKLKFVNLTPHQINGFNRTFLVLKYRTRREGDVVRRVLIAPFWY